MASGRKPIARGWKIGLAVGLLLVAALAAALYWYEVMRGTVSCDDARIDGDLVDLAPELAGTLESVLVDEGDEVTSGQLLFQLDRTLLEASSEQARAEVLSAKAALAVAEAGYEKASNGPQVEEIHMAEQAVKSAKSRARLAHGDWLRATKLFDSHTISQAELDKALTAWETASGAQREASDRLDLLRQGTRPEDRAAAQAAVEAARARVAVAEAALVQAGIRLDLAEVRAPFDGVVVRRWRDPGAMIAPGTPVLTVMDPSTLRVAANIEEKYLSDIAVGDRVRIEVDAFPQLELRGHVEHILPVTNSEFSLIPAEGVSGTFIKVTQRVPIRIAFDSPPEVPLGPGLSVEVRILLGGRAQPPPVASGRE